MVTMDCLIVVKGEPQEAVPLVQETLALVQQRFPGHKINAKVRFLCERCGQPMTLRGKSLVCDPCLADEELERQATWRREAEFYPEAPVPVDPLEALVD